MRHQPLSVRHDIYRETASITRHLQGDPPEHRELGFDNHRIPAQPDSPAAPTTGAAAASCNIRASRTGRGMPSVSTASEVRPSGRVWEAEAAETLAGRDLVLAGLIAGRAIRAGSAGGAGRRGLWQELVRLAVSVSWPRDRDLDLHDSSASGLALDLDRPSERFDSIPEPGQSRPPPRIGSADAVIANRKQKHVVLDTEGDPHARGVRVL